HLENDANLAGFGEYHRGAGRGSSNMVYITWSTGIGSGIVLGGNLYHGSHGTAGEIGHTVIEMDGEPCACGQRGCVEARASGAALERIYGMPASELFAR